MTVDARQHNGSKVPGSRALLGALRALFGLPLDRPEPDSGLANPSDVGLSDLAGVYALPGGPRFEFEERDGTLGLLAEDRFVPCTLLGTDRIALGHRRALFLRRDGKIWSLAVGDSILPRESRPDPLELAGGMAELQTAVMKETNGHV